MANEINGSELRFDIIKEAEEGKTPTTGNRQDLPAPASQAPLTYTLAQIVDDVRRANRETAAPTDGAATVSGSLAIPFRACPAIDILIESALSAEFDANGRLQGGEDDVSFSMYTTLTTRGRYLGYLEKGLVVSQMSLTNTASSDDSVQATFEVMGLTRDELETAPTQTVTGTTAQAFNYVDVGNLTIDGQAMEFADFEMSTGSPRAQRRLFGKRNATGHAPTGNRETSATFGLYRDDFDINDLVRDPVEVSFTITKNGDGYRFTFPHAKAVAPADVLSDTGLMASIAFTAHAASDTTPAVVVEKL